MILPLKRPSMRIVSSNSSSPRNDEPRSRKPFSSPLLFFISPMPFSGRRETSANTIVAAMTAAATAMSVPLTTSPHQLVDDANQLVLTSVADVDHAAAPSAVDFNFRS